MRMIRWTAAAALAAAVGCSTVPPPKAAVVSHADGEIYAAVFASAVGPQPDRPHIVVRDRSVVAQDWIKPADVRRVVPRASERLVDDFFARSAAEHPLAAAEFAGVTNLTVEMIGDEALGRAFGTEFKDQEWERFRDAHGGARSIVNLSPVGYDDAAGTALVYMDVGCGGNCGAAYLFLLDRRAGAWRVADTQLLWIR